MDGVSLADIRAAKIRMGLTDAQVDAEMGSLVARIQDQTGSNIPVLTPVDEPEIIIKPSVRRRRPPNAPKPAPVELNAYQLLMDRLSRTIRQSPINEAYVNELRHKMIGHNVNDYLDLIKRKRIP